MTVPDTQTRDEASADGRGGYNKRVEEEVTPGGRGF